MTKKTEDKKTVVESITMEDDEEENNSKEVNSLNETIKELGRSAFDRHIDKTSNLTNENIIGIIQAQALNEYMEVNFGYRYAILDKLCYDKKILVVSRKAMGLEVFKELVKSIQATFEHSQLPQRLQNMMNR